MNAELNLNSEPPETFPWLLLSGLLFAVGLILVLTAVGLGVISWPERGELTEFRKNFTYETFSDHVVITRCSPDAKKTVIPDFINGKPVTEICDEAFFLCTELKRITLPTTLERVRGEAFQGAIGVERYEIGRNPRFRTVNGILYSGNGQTLIAFPPAAVGAFRVPETVTEIGSCAFSASHLDSIFIPETVLKIGGNAFSSSIYLTSVRLPANLKVIPWFAFTDCRRLKLVTIPSSVRRIGASAFHGCRSLVSVKIPEGVEVVEGGTFEGCEQLKSATIFGSETWVSGAFRNCSSDLVLHVRSGSRAETELLGNGFRVEKIPEEE